MRTVEVADKSGDANILFDQDGRVNTVEIGSADWFIVTYRHYDDLGQVTQSSTNQNNVGTIVDYQYDSTGNVTKTVETTEKSGEGGRQVTDE